MAVTIPTIEAPGSPALSLALLRAGGLVAALETTLAANAEGTEKVKQLVRDTQRSRFSVLAEATNLVGNWSGGAPVDATNLNARLLECLTAIEIIKVALNAVATIIDANPGTIGGDPPARTWP